MAAFGQTAVRAGHGVVVDATTHAPIANAWVTAEGQVWRSDARGEFPLKTKAAAVDLRAPGYGRTRVDVTGSGDVRVALTPLKVRGLYLSFWAVSSQTLRGQVLNTAAKAHLNAVVIDVKGDLGMISLAAPSALVTKTGANKVITIPDAPGLIADLHQRGLYAIARIVTFKDSRLVAARPDIAVHREGGALFTDNEGLHWVDPFSRVAWDYNIGIAVAAAKAGFDEVEFDYVRFPDHKGLRFSKETTVETRTKAISDFLGEAQKALNPYNVFLSADNFGYVAWNEGDTGIGQRYEDVGKVVDYISPMLYPSGFRYGIPGVRNPLSNPYRIVNASLERAKQRTGFSGVVFRPWLQAFSDYAFNHMAFGKPQLRDQIKAAEDAGSEGWLLWNPRNLYATETLEQLSRELWWKEPVVAANAKRGPSSGRAAVR